LVKRCGKIICPGLDAAKDLTQPGGGNRDTEGSHYDELPPLKGIMKA
jgi:hypothetical protein